MKTGRYEILDSHYAGAPIKIIDTQTNYVVRQWETWDIGHMGALELAKRECKRLNQSGSTATDLLIVTVGILSIGALAFTVGAIPVLIGFAELTKILNFNF